MLVGHSLGGVLARIFPAPELRNYDRLCREPAIKAVLDRSDRSGSASYSFMLPLFLCGVLKVGIMSFTLSYLRSMPVDVVAAAATAPALSSQLLFLAQELALDGAAMDAGSLNATRSAVAATAAAMLQTHSSIVSSSTLATDSALCGLYFSASCLRADHACPAAATPGGASDAAAAASAQFGVDALTRAYVTEAQARAPDMTPCCRGAPRCSA